MSQLDFGDNGGCFDINCWCRFDVDRAVGADFDNYLDDGRFDDMEVFSVVSCMPSITFNVNFDDEHTGIFPNFHPLPADVDEEWRLYLDLPLCAFLS
ncbi:hypothetical protein NDU88_002673 [Pleurodeles waltl]|uniref:Uncharacterized protein n=1 Tax=Pleurodeles waltl TaxID=8319 RepID=A0AAV7KUC2_PLEWA|nr:hypothetical protein NDU88_002673 [Pleurodeles waltl]